MSRTVRKQLQRFRSSSNMRSRESRGSLLSTAGSAVCNAHFAALTFRQEWASTSCLSQTGLALCGLFSLSSFFF